MVGSEGAFGIITEVHVRLRAVRADSGFCLPDLLALWEQLSLPYIVAAQLSQPIKTLLRGSEDYARAMAAAVAYRLAPAVRRTGSARSPRSAATAAETALSPQMLARGKQQLKGSVMLGLESMSNRMQRLGRVELTFGRYYSLDEVLAEVEAVTAEDVRAAAETLFAPARLSTVAFVPEKAP